MAPRFLPRTLILFSQIHHILFVSATTTIHFYTDPLCKNRYATIHTDTDQGNGQCGLLPTDVNSASSVAVDNGCSGISSLHHLPSNEELILLYEY